MPWAASPGGGAAFILSAAIVFVRAICLFLTFAGGVTPFLAAAVISSFAGQRLFERN